MHTRIFLFLFFISALAVAQKTKVSEGNERFSTGSQNAFTALIYETDPDRVEKGWRSLMKNYNGKVSSGKDEMFADNASVKSISDNAMDVYARIEKADANNTRLSVAVDLGGAYLSSSVHGSKAKEMKDIIYNFSVKMSKESLSDQLKDAERSFDKLTKKQTQLVRDNETLHKDIESYKEKIKKAEEDIQLNVKDQDVTKKEVEAQQKVVDALKGKLDKVE